jgi:hypothetical protein
MSLGNSRTNDDGHLVQLYDVFTVEMCLREDSRMPQAYVQDSPLSSFEIRLHVDGDEYESRTHSSN